MGGIGVTWRFRMAASFSSSIQVGGHDGNLETLQTTSDFELLKAVGSDSQDGHHGRQKSDYDDMVAMAAILKIYFSLLLLT